MIQYLMNPRKLILSVSACMASVVLAQGQVNPVKLVPAREPMLPHFMDVNIKGPARPSLSFSSMPYTAFFCRMEVKAVNRLGFWLKIHAGDYESFTKPAR